MKKRISLFLVLTLIIGCLAGCSSSNSSSSSTSDSKSEKTLNFGSIGYFCNEDMDPGNGWNGWYMGYYGLSQQLFKLDDNFEPQNWLADSYKNVNDNTWEITLKDNVNFHNGKKMTAESVKNCFERTINVNERAKEADWIDSFEADGQTLTIKTTRAVPNIIKELSDPLWDVYYADEDVDYNDGKSYYTGPYVLKSFSANDLIEVVKNEDYWGDEPQLDSANFKTIADTESLTMALQNGEIDVAIPLLSDGIAAVENDKDITIDGIVSSRGQFLSFNMNREVVQDKAVRNAISMCIDRDNYTSTICNNTAVPSYGIYSESLKFGGVEGLKLTVDKYDLEGAKKLLEDAGYKDTDNDGILDKDGNKLSLKLVISSVQDDMIKMCEDLASKLSEIGVELNVVPMENTNDTLNTDDFDIYCNIYGMAPTGIADYFINMMFTTNGSGNIIHYSNKEVDKLAEELKTTFDEDKNLEKVKEIEQKVLDDSAYIFYAHKKFVVAYNNQKVTGFKTNPTEYYCLDENVGVK